MIFQTKGVSDSFFCICFLCSSVYIPLEARRISDSILFGCLRAYLQAIPPPIEFPARENLFTSRSLATSVITFIEFSVE